MEQWQPTVEDVAVLLRARTRDSNGVEVGDFNDETRPTHTQVQDLIEAVTPTFGLMLPDDATAHLIKTVRHLAALHVAMHVELSYFPEQIATGRSPYALLRESYEAERAVLLEQQDDVGLSSVAGPAYSFVIPAVTEPHLAGWRTPW